MVRRLGIVALLAAWGGVQGCGDALQFNLIIYDPCNQQTLAQADHIQVEIADAAGGSLQGTTWEASSGRGELPNLRPVERATVSVVLRAANDGGGPGEALAANGVGYLDLGEDAPGPLVELPVAVGQIDAFMRTTDTTQGSACSALVASRRDHTATLLPDGRVFIAGGIQQTENETVYWDTTELYLPRTGRFVRGPNMGTLTRRGHTATLLGDGRVLLVGGDGLATDGQGATTEDTWQVTQVFNPETEKIQTLDLGGDLRTARAYHTATRLADGRVLVAGGRADEQALGSTEIFDPNAMTFTEGPELTTARFYHEAARVGPQTVALVGGRGADGLLTSIEFVTVGETASAVAGPQLQTARSHAVAGWLETQNVLVVAGGFDAVVDKPESGANGIASVEVVALRPSDWSQSFMACDGQMQSPRGAAAAARVDGELLLAGGVGDAGSVVASAERVSVSGGGSCEVSSALTRSALSQPRADFQMTPLVSGDVLVTGGFQQDNGRPLTLSPGELYIRAR